MTLPRLLSYNRRHILMVVLSADSVFKVVFGAEQAELARHQAGAVLHLPLPLLGGLATEGWGSAVASVRQSGPFMIAESATELIGAALIDASGRLEESVQDVYTALLERCEGWHLYRVWNYVPRINECLAGLERYRQFNIGRWAAFESRFGRDLRSFMPAASAVGVRGEKFALLFKAGKQRPVYFENPSQVPAYHYPADYGPRPPGFARGVVIDRPDARTVFLSGTASIEGHRSLGEDDWALQFKTTMHNIEIMLGRMDVTAPLDAHFKCYLRYPELLGVMSEWMCEWLADKTSQPENHLTFVQADICRAELDLEIEAVFHVRQDQWAPAL